MPCCRLRYPMLQKRRFLVVSAGRRGSGQPPRWRLDSRGPRLPVGKVEVRLDGAATVLVEDQVIGDGVVSRAQQP